MKKSTTYHSRHACGSSKTNRRNALNRYMKCVAQMTGFACKIIFLSGIGIVSYARLAYAFLLILGCNSFHRSSYPKFFAESLKPGRWPKSNDHCHKLSIHFSVVCLTASNLHCCKKNYTLRYASIPQEFRNTCYLCGHCKTPFQHMR